MDEHREKWDQLSEQITASDNAGTYCVAAELAEKQLAIAEKHLSAELVATSLNNLGVLYDTQGKYAEAEQFLKRSLAIKKAADRIITMWLSP
jgi:tetratricopeptide (TPR) repeat protein